MPPARKPPPPGNPLWIEWLREWEKEMAEKSEHMPKTIRKAIKSFEQCPVPIDHPANANTLRNVGDKTMTYLTRRLKVYCEEHNLEMPEATFTNFEREAAKINKKKRKSGEPTDGDPLASGSGQTGKSDGENGEVNTSPPKKARKAKPYAPQVRSGNWAILIGLASYGVGAWKSEAEIIDRADPFYGEDGQSLKDKSTGGGAGSRFYTGWSSSKTLFAKGYLEKKSRNPVLYQLTHQGWKMARKAVKHAKRHNDINFEARRALPDFDTEDEESKGGQSDLENRPIAGSSAQAKATTMMQAAWTGKGKGKARELHAEATVQSTGEPTIGRVPDAAAGSPADPTAPFLFYYLGEDGSRVTKQDDAETIICTETFHALLRVEVRQCQAKHIFARKNIVGDPIPLHRAGPAGPEGATFSAYLRAKAAPAICPTFDLLKSVYKTGSYTSLSPKRPSSSQSSSRTVASDGMKLVSHPSSRALSPLSDSVHRAYPSTSTAVRSQAASTTVREESPDIVELDAELHPSLREKILSAAEARTSQQSPPARPTRMDLKGKGKAVAVNGFDIIQAAAAAAMASTRRLYAGPHVPMTVTAEGHLVPDIDALVCENWKPGDYTIELIIDNREKPGLSCKKLEDMLTAKGISWKAKALTMGDAIWVAKSKVTGVEVVLDVCLERKRLDDLLSSMRDGRYTEQKNRMVHSGISHLIYLVEEHDSKKAMETWGRQIWTMKSSLQIVDNFTVHIAWNTTEACNYLARLTKTFVDMFKDTTLTILPDNCLEKSYHIHFMNHLKNERPGTIYLYSIDSFQMLNCKQHSLHAGWAKMVASISQMSLASTERFLRKWPTPARFFEQLEETAQKDEVARIKFQEEEALDPYANKRAKKDDPRIGECWIMRDTVEQADNGETIRPIGQALSTNCWKLFAASKY